jgi:hypothetical protein
MEYHKLSLAGKTITVIIESGQYWLNFGQLLSVINGSEKSASSHKTQQLSNGAGIRFIDLPAGIGERAVCFIHSDDVYKLQFWKRALRDGLKEAAPCIVDGLKYIANPKVDTVDLSPFFQDEAVNTKAVNTKATDAEKLALDWSDSAILDEPSGEATLDEEVELDFGEYTPPTEGTHSVVHRISSLEIALSNVIQHITTYASALTDVQERLANIEKAPMSAQNAIVDALSKAVGLPLQIRAN